MNTFEAQSLIFVFILLGIVNDATVFTGALFLEFYARIDKQYCEVYFCLSEKLYH